MTTFGLGGNLSGGKTNFGVALCYEKAMREGKKIIANIQLYNFPDGCKIEYLPNAEFVEFLKENYENPPALRKKFFNTVLFLDEIANLVNARKSSSGLNELICNFIVLTGKLDCDVIYTFQVEDSQVDKILRNICNVYANCYRVDENMQPLIFERRKVNRKIYIIVVMELNFDILGIVKKQIIYDPSFYYNLYDTRELSLLDRSKYVRGGSRDLRY